MSQEGRRPRDLQVSDEVRRALTQLRLLGKIAVKPELEVDRVHEVESAFANRFSDDVLALFAAATPPLVDQYGVVVTKAIGHTGAMQSIRGARGDLVAIGKRDKVFVCVEKNDTGEHLVFFDTDRVRFSKQEIATWLQGFLEGQECAPNVDQFFQPCLYKKPPMTGDGVRVSHKKFGEGYLLCEIGTGPTRKVKVDFPGIGLKVIQARFLEGLE